MRKLLLSTGAMILAGSLAAHAVEGPYVGASATGFFLDSERTIQGADESLVGSVNLGYRFSNDWGLEAGYGTDLAGDDLDVAKLDLLRWFGDADREWRPYFVAGFSAFDRDDVDNLEFDEDETTQFAVGFGLSNMFADHWEFRTDLRVHQKIDQGVSGTTDPALNFAVNYHFNAPAPAPVAEPAPAPAKQAPPEMRTITVKLRVLFEFDKAVVKAIYGDEIQAVANAMKAHDDIDLVLEGHTDAIGTDTYNQDLSNRRAAAVKAKLVEMYGIDPSRVSTVGYGESRPVADNSTSEGRAQNRRVIGELSYEEVVTD
ncbi:MAG: hypothetical protein CMK32_11715 [Porticoccaceae bacterium]|nr:hypothetical protein [Porticoccaceae bacterium]